MSTCILNGLSLHRAMLVLSFFLMLCAEFSGAEILSDHLNVDPVPQGTYWRMSEEYKNALNTKCPKVQPPLSPDCVEHVFYKGVIKEEQAKEELQNLEENSTFFSPYADEYVNYQTINVSLNQFPFWINDFSLDDANCSYYLKNFGSCILPQMKTLGVCRFGTCVHPDLVDLKYSAGMPSDTYLSSLAYLSPSSVSCLTNGCSHYSTQCMDLQCVQDITLKDYKCVWIPEENKNTNASCSDGTNCMKSGQCQADGSCKIVEGVICDQENKKPCSIYECNARSGQCEHIPLIMDSECVDGTCIDGICTYYMCGNSIIDSLEECDWSVPSSGLGGMCCDHNCVPTKNSMELANCLDYSQHDYHIDCVISWCEGGKCVVSFLPKNRACHDNKSTCDGLGFCKEPR